MLCINWLENISVYLTLFTQNSNCKFEFETTGGSGFDPLQSSFTTVSYTSCVVWFLPYPDPRHMWNIIKCS